jgi:predicted AAA+ superfamily ATPase
MTLRGPRRAGKTVSLKLLVAELISQHSWNPREILWTSLESLRTLAQMEEHLSSAVTRHRPRLLLIDEATSVVGWQKVIKKLVDNGLLAKCCVILTGSSAHDLKAGSERMAGRRGDVAHPDRVLLPMAYGEFARQTSHVVPDPKENIKCFLRVGGFPFRVESFLRTSRWDDFSGYQIFDDVLFYEITRRRLNRSIALEVMGRLSSIGASAISYEAFAKPISIAKETARKYLDALGDAFLLATISSFDTSRNRVAPKKDRKLLWIDPALGQMAAWLRVGEPASEPARAEWAVGAELLRRFEVRMWEGLSAPRNVYTWKSSSGNEIDFLVVDRTAKLKLPVEVKYQNTISDWDFQIMERAFGKGWIVTAATNKKRPKAEARGIQSFLLTEKL